MTQREQAQIVINGMQTKLDQIYDDLGGVMKMTYAEIALLRQAQKTLGSLSGVMYDADEEGEEV